MNKYCVIARCEEIFGEEFKSSFREASYDSHNEEFLCQDSTLSPVYNFDKYVEAICQAGRLPRATA